MKYITAVELIDFCVSSKVLKEEDGKIFVYRSATETSKEGWYLSDKDLVAKELMKDEEGQKLLISALKKKGVDFTPTDLSWWDNFNIVFK